MANISKIKVNNNEYNIKDAVARGALGTLTGSNAVPSALSNKVGYADYRTVEESGATKHYIYFYKDDSDAPVNASTIPSTYLCKIDAAPFVKDGMISSVVITNGNLVITWNSDSTGVTTPTTIPLTDIFNPANYYDKDTIDGMLGNKADKSATVSNVSYSSSKIQKTINGTTTDVVTASTIVTDGGGYKKPSGGIPSTDMASAVTTSLGKADSSVQSVSINGGTAVTPTNGNVDLTIAAATWAGVLPSGGIPSTDLASGVQTSLGKADSAIQGIKKNGKSLTADANKVIDISDVVTTVKMNGSTVSLTKNNSTGAGEIDLGTVITSHQSLPTVDATVTSSSNNAVKSSGIYSFVADVYDGYDSTTETISFTFPTTT